MVGGEDLALLEKHGEKIVCTIVLAKLIFIEKPQSLFKGLSRNWQVGRIPHISSFRVMYIKLTCRHMVPKPKQEGL